MQSTINIDNKQFQFEFFMLCLSSLVKIMQATLNFFLPSVFSDIQQKLNLFWSIALLNKPVSFFQNTNGFIVTLFFSLFIQHHVKIALRFLNKNTIVHFSLMNGKWNIWCVKIVTPWYKMKFMSSIKNGGKEEQTIEGQ